MSETRTIESHVYLLRHADGTVAARVENGCLVLRQGHGAQKHETCYALVDVIRLMQDTVGGGQSV